MRDTKANGWFVPNSSDLPLRVLRLAGLGLAIGFVVMSGAARAQEETDEDKTFEEKIIDGVMAGIGGTNMDNRGIDYRERSPLVVPPKLDLPPPAAPQAEVKVPNWPKDPDLARRKAAIAAKKKENKDPVEAARILSPSELDKGKIAATPRTAGSSGENVVPGGEPGATAILSPSALGFTGSFSSLFGGSKPEITQFKGEPTRGSLTTARRSSRR